MTRILLVPDLPIERWPSMDRYASRLVQHLSTEAPGLEIAVAGEIGSLTIESAMMERRRDSGPGAQRFEPTAGVSEARRYLSRYLLYPRRVRAARANAIHVLDHSYAHLVLGERHRPSVITVHDLFPVITVQRTPSGGRARIRNWFLGRVLAGIRRADAWIVATQWLREQLGEWLGCDDRIFVIPYGIDDKFFDKPDQSRSECRDRWGIPLEAFLILHVGSVDRRKNLPAVIAVLEVLRKEGLDAWFLQVGGTLAAEHREELASSGVADYATQLGPVSETELRNAYHAADVLLFPSHYEGFGFPVLEAMASGLPAVTSGAGGVGEVAGDAAVVVGDRETRRYVEAVRRIADDQPWRSEMSSRGRVRASRFTWSKAARDTARVYETLV